VFTISAVMTFSTGIFLTAARFVEPLFRSILWSKFHQYYGDFYEPKGLSQAEIELQSNALSTFLQSSLNVELVYILLESITTFNKRSAIDENDVQFVVQEINPMARRWQQLQKSRVVPITTENRDLPSIMKQI
jgi:hypothetical protein